ncbi:MAG: hypothetical protein RL685_1133 [Pseudomonadota bacterium]
MKIHGISEDVNLAGNVRLIGKARNISKSDSMPDANTEFFGKDNPELLLHFQAALAGFTQESFSRFVRHRNALIRRKVTSFLGMPEA